MNGEYHIKATSTALTGNAGSSSLGFAPNHDYDNQVRPIGSIYNMGADQFAGSSTGLVITPSALVFAAQPVGATSPIQTVTVTNNGAAAYNFATNQVTVTSPFTIVNTSNCTGPLAVGGSCAINVAFAPTSATTFSGTLTVVPPTNGNTPTPAQTVALSGSGVSG